MIPQKTLIKTMDQFFTKFETLRNNMPKSKDDISWFSDNELQDIVIGQSEFIQMQEVLNELENDLIVNIEKYVKVDNSKPQKERIYNYINWFFDEMNRIDKEMSFKDANNLTTDEEDKIKAHFFGWYNMTKDWNTLESIIEIRVLQFVEN